MSKSFGASGKNILWSVMISGCSLLAAPYAVWAQDAPQGAGGGGAGRDPAAIYIQAGAGPDEVTKIRGVAGEFETKARATAQQLMTAFKDMQKLSFEPDLDEAKILATQDQINKLQADIATGHIKLLLACRKILTPEHRTKLVELLKQRREAAQAAGAAQ